MVQSRLSSGRHQRLGLDGRVDVDWREVGEGEMNAENLRILAHELRADPESYDQSTLGRVTDCGTVACIAGHATWLSGEVPRGKIADGAEIARKWLGLDFDESEILFTAWPMKCSEDCETCKGWPAGWGSRFLAAQSGDSPESPAHVAADLLDALADGKVSL